MENEHKKSKISLSKPEDIPQSQQKNYEYDNNIDTMPYQQDRQPYETNQQYQNRQYSQPQSQHQQTIYEEDTARRLPKYQMPDTYQQMNSPIPRNSPFQNSNYARTQQSTKYCKYCGEIIPFDAVVCTKCGRQVEVLQGNNYQQHNTYINNMNVNNSSNNNTALSTRNRSVAGVLCAIGLFGVGGLHRLYTGHIASGLLYLFTYGLFGIGTVVDLVRLIQGNFTDANGRLLKD